MKSESLEFELRTILFLVVFLGRLRNLSEPLSPLLKQITIAMWQIMLVAHSGTMCPLFLLSQFCLGEESA